ncbi:MAG: hypothetical protein JF589_13340 [Gemmatimonadetes bacterium]|nr:hypothetical protein [Gemmatimonadota bacterium]
MELYGTRGYVMTDNRSMMRTRVSEEAKESTVSLPELDSPRNDPFSYLKALIEHRVQPSRYEPSSLENNMLVMEILDAAKQSAQQGKTIRF